MGRPLGRLRRLPEIECLFPKTLSEALSLLEKHKGQVKVIAGGTDLLSKMKRRELTPKYLIDLKGIEDLNFINYDSEKGLMIGAMATLSEVEESSIVRKDYPILVDALSQMGSMQVRNIGTIVGNLCNAVPSADSAPPLMALEGRLKIMGPEGERTVLVEDFFKGPEETLLDQLELVTGVEIPPKGPDESGTYIKHTYRGAMDLALVGIAVYLAVDSEKNMCRDIRIAMGAVGPVPMRARKAEEVLRGKTLTDDLIETAAKTASEESNPRSFPEYKREMVMVLTKRAIKKSLESR
ncbi:MAG: FAD binding domain-containing protein [Pseudomonadota bacterium]